MGKEKKMTIEDKDRVKVGDRVMVGFTTSEWIPEAIVTALPEYPGDTYWLQLPDGHVVYVQQFERMDMIDKGQSGG